jgi:hypothetical protein
LAAEIHVEVLQPEVLGDALRIGGRIRGHPRLLRRNGLFFFDVPERTLEWLAIRGRADDIHDAFLRATIWSAMEAGGELTIHGRVSARLLANMERYQDIVCRWWPQYRPVRLRADEEIADEAAAAAIGGDPARKGSAVLAYSGGLDSTESLVAHTEGWRGRNTLKIGACVFVHGFDLPLHDDAFQGACRRARAVTDHYSTELVAVRSNLKYLLPLWETTFSAGISAVLSLFERRFQVGLLAASTAYENVHWIESGDGSTPWSDPLFSSATFRVVPDLAGTRVEKTERLAGDELVWQNLRVCWEGEDLSTNCGRCEKCVRQMLCMLACGIEDFTAFERPLAPAVVLATNLPMTVVVEEWRRCYERALERELDRDGVFLVMKEVLDRASKGVGETAGSRLRRLGKRVGRRLRRLGSR